MIVINFANLHHGGGVQVAVSFLRFLSRTVPSNSRDIIVLVSSEVLHNSDIALSDFPYVRVLNVYSLGNNYFSFRAFKPRLIFTLFGPFYYCPKSVLSIVGFAQPNIAYKDLISSHGFGFDLSRVKYRLQELCFFRFSDYLVVETDDVKNRIANFKSRVRSIEVIPNEFNMEILSLSVDTLIEPAQRCQNIGIIAANYGHKNWAEALSVIQSFEAEGVNCKFFITLSAEEIGEYGFDVGPNVVALGRLRLSELKDFYTKMDTVWCPSRLECFSATPLEALYFDCRVVLPNLPFNSFYEGFADFYEYGNMKGLRESLLSNGYAEKERFLFTHCRNERYMLLIERVLNDV